MKLNREEAVFLSLGIAGILAGVVLFLMIKTTLFSIISGIILSASIIGGIIYPIFLRPRLGSTEVDADFTFLLQHLLSVSTGNPPRSSLFEVVSKENIYPKYSPIFLKIYKLGKEWGYSFPQACRLVGKEVGNKVLKEFLSRLSIVLSVGEDVEQFLRTELSSILNIYETQYMRTIEAMNVFLGIYTSLLAASVFMLANFLLLAFFFGGDISMVTMSYAFVIATIGIVALVLYITVPQEAFENKLEPRPRAYAVTNILSIAITLTFSVAFLFLALKHMLSFYSIGILLIAYGAFLYIPGRIAKGIENLIENIDDFFPVFIRSYSLNYETIPNHAKALKPMLLVELGKLSKILKNLYARLMNGINPQIAWRMMAAETRSELARRFLKIFEDTIEKGGKISQVGASISGHYNTIVGLRRNRLQVAKTFEMTTYIMQGAIVVINIFVSSLLQGFSQMLSSMQSSIPGNVFGIMFGSNISIQLVMIFATVFSFATALLNALSINKVTPGVSKSFWYYFSILLVATGAGIIAGEFMISYILNSALQGMTNLI
ncbi:type II secretion system F family protein [Fervidicoccus fontis]|jgi:flagellar protein FlaJ|uniref:Type II secretion system protein GspF domain-containing protein n=2 Tax=Fervidicoccus TaxID=685950 RepID=A0A7C2ZD28_9CREN|nr:type II secretion system F family protein [Fervidicoccus fontis]PMB77195.1 MAG: hypothetical protein C0177_03945 [Fervidicoccus fontis]HEW63590.1 hypothetical protein [Fervidicoccus fontis]